MGYGYDAEENIGVDKCNLTTFAQAFKGQLQLVTGLIEMPEGLTLEDVRKPSMVMSDPGIGKTSIIISIREELNQLLPPEKQLGFKKILLGQTVVGALSGIPVVNPQTGVLKTVQPEDLPNAERDGEYGILFFDEITTADEAQVQPALGLADDSRNIGPYSLPEHWVVVAAGNGPSCANFVELHDMTINRFVAYDIRYDYHKDWRPWAHAHNINELIIAFLNFKPEFIINVVTGEADKSGKQYASPRSWTRLSTELKIRAATGNPVSQAELQGFASRIIGSQAAVEFAAFTEYNTRLEVNPQDIIDGKVSAPSATMTIEEFHIIVQRLVKLIIKLMKDTKVDDGVYTLDTYNGVANVMRWVCRTQDMMLDKTISAIMEINREVPDIQAIVYDTENFEPLCPELTDFYFQYNDVIVGNDALESL